MIRRMILPLLFGLTGAAVLSGLGIWQVQRLAWKTDLLAGIDARIADAPVALAEATGDYQPVQLSGRYTGQELHVLASLKREGAIYRIISAFETPEGRRILVDRGFVPATDKTAPRTGGQATLTGNLHSPDEVDFFTPEPDLATNIWYARDVPAMASALGTEEVFVILRETSETPPPVTPLPVDTSGIPNDHFGYAVTWFSLAAIWLGMTAALLWRIRRKNRAGHWG